MGRKSKRGEWKVDACEERFSKDLGEDRRRIENEKVEKGEQGEVEKLG